LSVLLWAGAPPRDATGQTSTEYQVKAVFLFNFAQFVKWPPHTFDDPEEPLCIGILGDDPFGTYLDGIIQGEKVDGHPLMVRRFERVEDVKGCHILFICGSERKRLKKILAVLEGRKVLTVSDIDGFARTGGMIRFMTEGKHIHLRVNLEAVKKARLVLSSKLLRLAEIAGTEGN
jgi:hypothetical protein